MGEIRKRGKFYQIRFYRNGQRIEESTGYTKYDDARDLLRKRENQISEGVAVTAQSTRFTWDDALKDVVTDYSVNSKKSTAWVERRAKLHLTPVFRGRKLSSIGAADLRGFAAARLEAKAKPAEINRELAIVRRAFRLAVENEKYFGRVPKFPMLSEANNVRTGFFDRDSFDAVRSHLPRALRPVVTFGFITGWRLQSEVMGMQWRQVDRDACSVRLDAGTTKNKRGRHLDYSQHPELVELFTEQWRQHEALKKAGGEISPYVFQRNGKRIKNLRGAWKSACVAAGVPGRQPHDLRRSAVRNLVRSGVPDSVAMKITGHATRSVFDRYDISSEADIREGLGRVFDATGTKCGDNRPHASDDAKQQTA